MTYVILYIAWGLGVSIGNILWNLWQLHQVNAIKLFFAEYSVWKYIGAHIIMTLIWPIHLWLMLSSSPKQPKSKARKPPQQTAENRAIVKKASDIIDAQWKDLP